MAGVLGGLLHGVPHVLTAHSLEPQRPWKAEQLGGGYRLSSWAERTAYRNADAVIAVSHGMKRDILAVYPSWTRTRCTSSTTASTPRLYAPDRDTDVLERHGVDPDRPYVVFVGRITRQKGVGHLLAAARDFVPEAQLVLCAGAPDTPEIAAETAAAVAELQETRTGVVWISRDAAPAGRGAAAHRTRPCSSARRCTSRSASSTWRRWPARPRSSPRAVGGIPEVVADGETGTAGAVRAGVPGGVRGGAGRGGERAGHRPGPGRRDGQGRAGAGPTGSSAGTRSPAAPSRSTARCARPSRRSPRRRVAGGRGPSSR